MESYNGRTPSCQYIPLSLGSCYLLTTDLIFISFSINQIVFLLAHIQLNIKLIQPGLFFFQLILLGEGALCLFLCRFQLRRYML